jgi:two-component system sensor histidine kinase KdpD
VTDFERLLDPDTRRLLESCANQLSVALERDQLAMDVVKARIEAEAAPFRSKPLEQYI